MPGPTLVTVAVANWRVGDHPENTDYIMAGVEDTGTLLDQRRGWGGEQMYAALRRACAAVHPGGRVVISEPPVGDPVDRWPPDLLLDIGVVRLPSPPQVASFQRQPLTP